MIADLLHAAEALARFDERRPKQASLRRAMSSAYYAVFHALAKTCADELIGVTRANTDVWVRVYRALDHREAKKALSSPTVLNLHAGVATFGLSFVALQDQRLAADYDPRPFPHGRQETLAYVNQARTAVAALNAAPSDRKRSLAGFALFRSRS
jgi:hypothetical protein